jgi:hypothetical protein
VRPADWIRAVTGETVRTKDGEAFVPVALGVAVYLRVGPIEAEIGTLPGVNPMTELPDLLEATAAEMRKRLAGN